MNHPIRLKTMAPPLLMTLTLLCIALLPRAQAVVPPPDGGYPNFTTAEGQNALFSLTTGAANTAVGWFSLKSVTTGSFNTGVGAGTLVLNTANRNTATGAGALLSNTIGVDNTANGAFALLGNTEGSINTATGAGALFSNTIGIDNTANGVNALHNNIAGNHNTAIGGNALQNNTSGFNTANGSQALEDNTTGSGNTATGSIALHSNTTGNNNTTLGYVAGGSITGNGNVCIGAGVFGEAGVDDSTYIRNVNTLTQNFSAGVNDYVTVRLTDGRLGHTAVVSSQRYKQDIKPLATTSEALYSLKPVSFRLKKEFDATQALGFGLIAEEVEKVDPALVYRNAKGHVESVRYEMVNAMLLNEFLKEHKTVQELKAILAQQQTEIAALIAHIKEQDAKIQTVSDQLEMSTAAPKVASVK